MNVGSRFVNRSLLLAVVAAAFLFTTMASAQVALTQLSHDTFTDTASQHATEVEPGAFTWGSTIVTGFQVASHLMAAAGPISVSRHRPMAAVNLDQRLPPWAHDLRRQRPERCRQRRRRGLRREAQGVVDLDASDRRHNKSVAVSRSTDGINWGKPIAVTKLGSPDKNWIVCDNTATSKYYGHCYSEWDDTDNNDTIEMSTSTDGGLTWSKETETAAQDQGVGGVPLVLPNGTVVVPINGFNGRDCVYLHQWRHQLEQGGDGLRPTPAILRLAACAARDWSRRRLMRGARFMWPGPIADTG